MRITLLPGRDISDADAPGAERVAVVSRHLALRLALGAGRASVQRLVLGQTLRLACVGAGSGLIAAIAS